ncbi:PREDICTED: mediator of RNA polymerase II transcription subunit 12-like protein [Priapulus caudatus]|uniref:Mediator of RNA polymerase II transcription subunit 12-like protein n=1 Tax=Priapulus caudatus TaxID=37621 RepID=A0ABM1E8F1_PRICU|nr:PREDICTED: mediator of RNA polymerase II transcription subunit 12-like protein [Priapulus caudatus]
MTTAWLEKRPLKRQRLGPPDVYPQDPKQKEDELTSDSVKSGFSNRPPFGEEYGSARDYFSNPDKFNVIYSQMMQMISKKQELNTLPDTGKKRPQINTKDNFVPANLCKVGNWKKVEAWLKDLAGSKSLTVLAKKVPILNKKEDIFTNLYDFQVPMLRATWLIKMTSAYNVALNEAKIKKKQPTDPSQEWTQALTRFLRDLLNKLTDWYHGQSTAGGMPAEVDAAMKQWQYCQRLTRYMYEEGLVERQEFLAWILDLLERVRGVDDGSLKLLLPLALEYLDEFVQSQQLSRRLAHYCAKKLVAMATDSAACASPRTQSPLVGATGEGAATGGGLWAEYGSCAFHRGLVLSYSCMLQCVTLCAPTALVWSGVGSGAYAGSPLDLLPCAPSALPMPPLGDAAAIRRQVRASEEEIRRRGAAVEARWSSDTCRRSTRGHAMQRVLSVLEALDRHSFDRSDANNCLDVLYNKIFPSLESRGGGGGGGGGTEGDRAVVLQLCEWAVSTHRSGDHRAVVVAKLLEKRQGEIAPDSPDADSAPPPPPPPRPPPAPSPEQEEEGYVAAAGGGGPVFQNLLLHFLDSQAPTLDERPCAENREQFANLVLLFCELIQHDVFSHDKYMCALISRGDLVAAPTASQLGVVPQTPDARSSVEPCAGRGAMPPQSDLESALPPCVDLGFRADGGALRGCDEAAKLDDDFNRVFQNFAQKQDVAAAIAAATKMEFPMAERVPPVQPPATPPGPPPQQRLSRHYQYTLHFPVPPDDAYAHECNQRLVTLYGVGRARDDARHMVRRVQKELQKLFGKKNSLDLSAEGAGKPKRSRGDPTSTFESIFARFRALSYFDQHHVTHATAGYAVEQLSHFVTDERFNYLPAVEHLGFLFDLMEHALNISGLLDFCNQLLKVIPAVQKRLEGAAHALVNQYPTTVCLHAVAVFRKYHAWLLIQPDHEQTVLTFEGLINVVQHVGNPSDCTSAERCILTYVYDLYWSCPTASHIIKTQWGDMFPVITQALAKVKQSLYASVTPSTANLPWDRAVMADHLARPNPRNRPDPELVRQLKEAPATRYAFVCNALLAVCRCGGDSDNVNDVAILCAELTACCNALSSEWLGALKALCCSFDNTCGFVEILTEVDVGDAATHDPIAVFTSVLVARHCLALEDIVFHVALPSLVASTASVNKRDADAGARLTCHLLRHLFRTTEGALARLGRPRSALPAIRTSCDRHLLDSAHASITVDAVLAVLKAILMMGDTAASPPATTPDDLDDDPPLLGVASRSRAGDDDDDETGLRRLAKKALTEICSENWVLERCLKDSERLCTEDLLLDPMLKNKQGQQLLRLICYSGSGGGGDGDRRATVCRILRDLDQWSLCVSWLELQLILMQCPADERNSLMDVIARATIDVFQSPPPADDKAGRAGREQKPAATADAQRPERSNIWLVAPLVAKLPAAVQGKVLRAAGQVLESCNWSPSSSSSSSSSASKKDRDRAGGGQRGMSPPCQQPFLCLVLTCLRGKDEQREGLLFSLYSQLGQYLHAGERCGDDARARQSLQEALQLRLSLVGGMFDVIQRSAANVADWAVLFVQLACARVVDPHVDRQLFTTIVDMLSALIHAAMVAAQDSHGEKPDAKSSSSSSSSSGGGGGGGGGGGAGAGGEDAKKMYANLKKKLQKEIGDRDSDGVAIVRQLLPLAKKQASVIVCEPTGSLVDTKGNKIAGFDSIDKKKGLQVADKTSVSPWELFEGLRNPAPLSWAWFGAVRMERKALKYEEQHRMLLYHTHALKKPAAYYLSPPQLPPEDLEPPPPPPPPPPSDKLVKKELMMMQKEGGGGGGGGEARPDPPITPKKAKGAQRRRRASRVGAAQQVYQGQSPGRSMPPTFPEPSMYQAGGGGGTGGARDSLSRSLSLRLSTNAVGPVYILVVSHSLHASKVYKLH